MNYKILLLVRKLISRAFSISFCQHVLMRMKDAVKAVKNVNYLQTLANIPILTTEKTNKK